jgi:protein gp37
MAETKIQWAHYTFNPWLGCSKVSPACANCYAEAWAKRSGLVKWGVDAERRRTSESNWREPLKWNREAKNAGERRRVFCASLADVFEDREELAPWRDDLFELIGETTNLDWLLLTKRPENLDGMLPWTSDHLGEYRERYWPQVWIGTTIENQEQADNRLPHLLGIPAAVRFLSVEPLLGPIDLDGRSDPKRVGVQHWDYFKMAKHPIDWIIIGGESGPNARPMNTDNLISLRDQCLSARVPVFIKQMGDRVAAKFGCRDPKGGDPSEWPAEYRIRQFPDVAAINGGSDE